MEKRFVTDEEYADHKTRCLPVPAGEAVKYSLCRQDPVYFVVNQLGIRPFAWQAEFLDLLMNKHNVLACTSRQIGKTSTLAWFALWACTFNALPLTTTKKTRIIFVSKTDGQAMKVIADVREYMRMGDDRVHELTKGKVVGFFKDKVASGDNTVNTKSTITFKNGCQIVSLPPTDAARGYTASMLFIDEVAFIPDNVIRDVLLPIVSATGNRVSCTSTPNGKQGWFYRMFDPDDQLDDHPFVRLWLPYDCIRHDDPDRCERFDKDKQMAIRLNEERSFLQEYEADFTASEAGFFDANDVDAGIRKEWDLVSETTKECDLGIDFGKQVSRTVLSIVTTEKDKDGDPYVRLLYQYEYGEMKGVGSDLVDDVAEILKKYNIQRIIVEDCPQSAFFQHACTQKGWPMQIFNPSADKNKYYHLFRSWLRQGKIRYPFLPELVRQMNGMVTIQLPVKERIEHGSGLRDDCVDSFVMSCTNRLVDTQRLRVLSIDGLNVWGGK